MITAIVMQKAQPSKKINVFSYKVRFEHATDL